MPVGVASAPVPERVGGYRPSRLIVGLTSVFVAGMPFAPAFQWHPGVFVDPGDLMMLPLLVLLVRRAFDRPDEGGTWWEELPCRRLWCAYGILVAIAYARWSYDAGFFGGGALYQFYRYCWKPMLLYPVTFYMVGTPGGLQWVMAAFVSRPTSMPSSPILQGRSGVDVRGVMSLFHKNMLAGSFLVPLFLALGEARHAPMKAWRLAARGSALVIAAGLWYAVSRGAIVGAVVGAARLRPCGAERVAAGGGSRGPGHGALDRSPGPRRFVGDSRSLYGHRPWRGLGESRLARCASDGRIFWTSWRTIPSSEWGRPRTTRSARTPTPRTTAIWP